MATQKKKETKEDSFDFEQMKEEVLQLITGQDPDNKGDFDYVALVKRVTVILVAVYGVSRVQLLRQLAISIATTAFTRWLAQKAAAAAVPGPVLQPVHVARRKRA